MTKTQRKILGLMLSGPSTLPGVTTKGVYWLLKAGWAKKADTGLLPLEYELTEAGRAALTQAEAEAPKAKSTKAPKALMDRFRIY